MDVTLPADLAKQVEQEFASGHYRDELIEQAAASSMSASVVSSGSMLSAESVKWLIKWACTSEC